MAPPIDARAAKICQEDLTPLMKMPLAKRKLSDAQVTKLIKTAEIDSVSVRQCVCLGLAFAQDSNSLEVLGRLTEDRTGGVRAAARYALKVRENAGRKPHEMLNNLCFWLGRAEDPMEKIFLANRMWVDFGEDCIGTILLAAKCESESVPSDRDKIDAATIMKKIARCDLLYYLSESANKDVLAEALKITLDDTVAWSLAESDAYILGSVTPGRPIDKMSNSQDVLVRKIRAKLGDGK